MKFCPKIGFFKNTFGCDIVISWFGRENKKVPSMPKRKYRQKKANKKAKQKNVPQNLYVKYDFSSPIQSSFFLYFLYNKFVFVPKKCNELVRNTDNIHDDD